MNGRAAKAIRREERDRLKEFLAQAHDRLHKDDVDAAHELIHQALGSGEIPAGLKSLTHRHGFDEAFRSLCLRHGVAASYVLVDEVDDDGMARLLSGGDALLTAQIDAMFRRSRSAVSP